VLERKVFEKQLERFTEGTDYEVLQREGKNEGKKIYLLSSEKMIQVC
jgi:hypothetical protein